MLPLHAANIVFVAVPIQETLRLSEIGNLIFVSYRRADTAPHALALKLELETKFRAAQVFLDTHVIQAGDAWPSQIENALKAAKVIVPLIGKSWEAKSTDGSRRIDDPTDWVHREIKFALENKKDYLVPILVDGRPSLRSEDLPVPLAQLTSIQAGNINVHNWDSDVNKLVQTLKDKFSFQEKATRYRFPKPDPHIAKTIPYPWEDLETDIPKYLGHWRIEFSDDPDKLHYKRVELTRDFEFRSFGRAIEFMNAVAKHATETDHHPRWMNVWKTVTVWLSTWDAGHRVTVLDVNLARFLERKYKEFM